MEVTENGAVPPCNSDEDLALLHAEFEFIFSMGTIEEQRLLKKGLGAFWGSPAILAVLPPTVFAGTLSWTDRTKAISMTTPDTCGFCSPEGLYGAVFSCRVGTLQPAPGLSGVPSSGSFASIGGCPPLFLIEVRFLATSSPKTDQKEITPLPRKISNPLRFVASGRGCGVGSPACFHILRACNCQPHPNPPHGWRRFTQSVICRGEGIGGCPPLFFLEVRVLAAKPPKPDKKGISPSRLKISNTHRFVASGRGYGGGFPSLL